MFLCRTRRLLVAALDQASERPGSFLVRVKVNGPRDVSLTARTGPTFQRLRFLSASTGGLEVKRAPHKPEPVQNWDESACLVITEWALLDRVAALAGNLSRSVHQGGGEFCKTRLGGDAKGVALFTGKTSSRSMPTRAASTGAATKRSEEQTDSSKPDLQEASSTSSTEKDPGNTPDPEEGKPSKAQQLKKVFKEYGASLLKNDQIHLHANSGIDMTAMLYKLGFGEELVQSKMAAGTSTFVLAYAIHKLFAPVRMSITVVSVPLIVRYFRKTGLFKPPTPAP
ncbi:hypothetical protein XENOCAPTIV_029476 [Xenoophorus captivus]|uniref:DUF1279 domain-containing protein n=1 Tax=Xenoophorus captivus TaxID=1517983 RepID=A0ABV0QX71_9TELE